uniref:G-protein coupled receptors family 1 profile domain-containing protein n=1 Tax=Scophthalmus maximus TaxID=52904 RepID=A0A8D3CUI4_SCOMX
MEPHLEGFYIPPGNGSFLFFLALFNYIVVLLANGVVMCVIVIDKNLHRPMFVLVCNLVVCDLLGSTAVLPRLMMHSLTGEKRIGYMAAIAQAFSVHTYGAAMQTILGAMAYDRYIAVCEPLRYHAIMTPARLNACCILAWSVALLCIIVLFALHANTPLCGNTIRHVYCSNRTILSLACGPTPINNIYGQCIATPNKIQLYDLTYLKIIKQGRADSRVRSKAFQTCSTHLVVYLLFQVAVLIIVVSQRFTSVSKNIKKFFSILLIIMPPAINPIIYGLVSKELRASIFKHLTIKVSPK